MSKILLVSGVLLKPKDLFKSNFWRTDIPSKYTYNFSVILIHNASEFSVPPHTSLKYLHVEWCGEREEKEEEDFGKIQR